MWSEVFLFALLRIRNLFYSTQVFMFMHFMSSRLDYCNSLCTFLSKIPPIYQLYIIYLCLLDCIFKIDLINFNALSGLAPPCLRSYDKTLLSKSHTGDDIFTELLTFMAFKHLYSWQSSSQPAHTDITFSYQHGPKTIMCLIYDYSHKHMM